MRVEIFILNYNGRRLLDACLESVLRAADRSQYDCRVTLIDNSSTDRSVPMVRRLFPRVRVVCMPNDGLCSFNPVLAVTDAPYAILLNNDIELEDDAVDPLIDALRDDPQSFMTAPLCWQRDGGEYEGFKTAVRWRLGLVQATARFNGCESSIAEEGLTASAGAAFAVDVAKYNALGGFDPRYLPGRIEDLDLAIRGYLRGWHARYVPRSVAWHHGMATFEAVYGREGCDRLALRNTLLWQWKNLRHPWHIARQVAMYPARVAVDVLQAPLRTRQARFRFTQALLAAWRRWRQVRRETALAARAEAGDSPVDASRPERIATTGEPICRRARLRREREFFRRFSPSALRRGDASRSNAVTDQLVPTVERISISPATAAHDLSAAPASTGQLVEEVTG